MNGSDPQGGHKHGDPNTCTCPHCWTVFKFENALYVARDPKLIGDPVLGPEAPTRFKPTRFSAEGHAIDPGGYRSLEMACPRCHLDVPQGLTEFPSVFFSIIGSVASGKSVLLGSVVYELRRVMAKYFGLAFSDLEMGLNSVLHSYEETLFAAADDNVPVAIKKTEQQGDLYDRVVLDGNETRLPKPFMFTIRPQAHHPAAGEPHMSRTLVLYDNAGEHFEPNQDTARQPGTMHMARSECLLMIFDPTQDVRFRALLKDRDDPQIRSTMRPQRQGVVIGEAIQRIRRHLAIQPGKQHGKWIVVVVNKSDVWRHLIKTPIHPEPFVADPKLGLSGLDLPHVEDVSFSVRHLLEEHYPEIVSTVEHFGANVIYVPVSPLGCSPTVSADSLALQIKPKDIKPHWVTVPFITAFARLGMVYRTRPTVPDGTEVAEVLARLPTVVRIRLEDGSTFVVPNRICGMPLHHPVTGTLFVVPKPTKPAAPPTANAAPTPPTPPPMPGSAK